MGVICRALSGRREGQAPWRGRAGRTDLVHQAAEMRLFHRAKPTGTVLGREAPGVDGVADKSAVGIAAIGLQLGHGDHLVDDPRQLEPGLRSVDLRLEDAPVEVVELLVEDPHETELPQALKWQVARADEDYDAAQVEARRITVDTTRIASESFPMAIPPEEAERRCRRALMEAWVGRESAVFRLPPSRLALDPCDVILLDHDGRLTEMRLVSIADSDLRSVDAVRQDRAVYDLPPGEPRPAS